MKLSKFTAKSIEIDFNDEVREVEMNFAVMQQMTQNLGNLLDYALHVYRVAAQMEMPDAVRLSAFYAELLRIARFRFDGKPVTAEMIYQAVQADPDELSNLIESCFNASLIICPVSDKPAPATSGAEPEKKPVKRTRKPAG